MSNSETTVPINNFTIGSLKVYEDEKVANLKELFLALRVDDQRAIKAALTAQEKAVAAALAAAEKAVEKADTADQKHFETINERNREIDKLTSNFLPIPQYDANHKALEDKIDTKCKALEDKIQALTDRLNISTGKSSGISAVWGSIGVGIGLLIAAVSVILTFNN